MSIFLAIKNLKNPLKTTIYAIFKGFFIEKLHQN